MYSGPHIKRDGLVFGYDTGYGIADNNTATRFYPGRPTTNEISDANLMSGWSSYSSGNDGTFTTEFGTIGYRINNRASWNGLYKDFSLPSTGTYTFSALFRYRGGSSSNNGATVYVSGWGGSDTATGIDKTKVNEWQRIEKTVSVTDTTLRYYLISYGGSGAVSSWDATMPQIEKQTTRSPFLTGTRSSTQSLIDLTKTTDIDVSNVSFDSTGQPTFDGTDDLINVNPGTFPSSWSQPFTLEAIVYIPSSATWYNQGSGLGIVGRGSYTGSWGLLRGSGDNTVYFWMRTGGNTFNPGGTIGRDKYYHILGTWNGSNQAIFYINGNQNSQETSSNVGTTVDNTGNIVIGGNIAFGGSNGGYGEGTYPVVKLYNRALTPQEVKQNFRAYKNRFDI